MISRIKYLLILSPMHMHMYSIHAHRGSQFPWTRVGWGLSLKLELLDVPHYEIRTVQSIQWSSLNDNCRFVCDLSFEETGWESR